MTPKSFLISEGFDFETPFDELTAEVAEAFGQRSEDYLATNDAVAFGARDATDLYRLPQCARQSSAMFSIDRQRYLKNLRFFQRLIRKRSVNSMIEFGSGDGLLLRFIRELKPDARVLGVEREANLARIACEDRGVPTIKADYRELGEIERPPFEMGIWNFGWENAEFPLSQRPHETRVVGGREICGPCAEDLRDHLISILRPWDNYLARTSVLVICGRIGNPTEGMAFASAAATLGWRLSLPLSEMVKVDSEQGFIEHFPHLVFERDEANKANQPEKIMRLGWRK